MVIAPPKLFELGNVNVVAPLLGVRLNVDCAAALKVGAGVGTGATLPLLPWQAVRTTTATSAKRYSDSEMKRLKRELPPGPGYAATVPTHRRRTVAVSGTLRSILRT